MTLEYEGESTRAREFPGWPGVPRAPTVTVVIPVLNEEEAIGPVIRAIPRVVVGEIIVVDGGSCDRTVDVARAAGTRVLMETRRGYGRACASGALAATGEVVVFLDGDGSDDPAAIPRVVQPILDGEADLVLGARSQMQPGALPAYARLGNAVASRVISLFWRQPVTDLPSFKAIRRRELIGLGMTEATYGWTIELIVKAARQGRRIHEVPLVYRARLGGESKVSGNPRASVRAAMAILSVLFRHGLARGEDESVLLMEQDA